MSDVQTALVIAIFKLLSLVPPFLKPELIKSVRHDYLNVNITYKQRSILQIVHG